MRLVNQLKRCRFDRDDLTQQALAEAVGVTRQTIIAIEKGRFVPSTLLALKLARFFGKPVEAIFRIAEDSPSAPVHGETKGGEPAGGGDESPAKPAENEGE